jgi:lipid A ethanolaminephosphotransferase
VLLFSPFYTSFFREHKPLRSFTNPTFLLYSIGKYINKNFSVAPRQVKPLGTDAKIPATDLDRELIILVVGEAARADHFSLNGYQRPTNPRLQRNDVISFRQMYSSGTSTAFSVPCMFSNIPREQFSERKGAANENLLDVLVHAGVNVLWRENNSDSKGVAVRVPNADYKTPKNNQVCDIECRDEGMLVGLQDYIDTHPKGDIVIVLHQMGNHGPAYYKRYPKTFATFTPTCDTNQLEECTNEEIGNTYDNAILYTDYFLDQVIALLKKNTSHFETAMFYMSDHGESLGEYGIYLHGLPYAMAPENQKHVASVLWFGDSFHIDQQAVRRKADTPLSHANFFHTVLGLMEIQTSVYKNKLDILSDCRPDGLVKSQK